MAGSLVSLADRCDPREGDRGAPWFVADSNDKKRARLNIISHLLDQIPYEPTPPEEVKLPKRQKRGDYTEPDRQGLQVPARC